MTEENKPIDMSLAENPKVILALHELCIEIFGGLNGVKNENSFLSALNKGLTRLYYVPNTDVFSAVCAIGYGLARNHPFQDGNKRIAALFTLAQLEINGYVPKEESEHISHFFEKNSPKKKLTQFFEKVAAGEITEEEMFSYARNNFRPANEQEKKSPFINVIMAKIKGAMRAITLFLGF